MAFQGSLQDIALPDILQLLAAQGKNGILTLTRGREWVRIGIVEGQLADADSSAASLDRRLGTKLLRAGKLASADLGRALALRRASRRKLSEILVSDGMAPADDVRRALGLQVLHIVYGVLRWDEGSYDFERREVDYDRASFEPVSVQRILMDGMRMIDEWPLIEKRFASRRTVLHRVPRAESGDGGAGGPLDAEELEPITVELYERVDGRATIQQLIDRSMHLEFDVCRALHDLWERGWIGPAYEGRLDEVDFADLVLAIRNARGTGQLELRRGSTLVTLVFRAGDFMCASSSDPDDGIGPYLLRRGAIGRRDLEAAAAAAPEAIGEHLTRSGGLDPEGLLAALPDQMAEIVRSLFAWTEGTYRYRPGLPAEAPDVDLERRTPAIILKGIRSVDRWSRIERAVGAPSSVYRSGEPGQDGSPEALGDQHRWLLDLFAGGLGLAEACERAPVPEFLLHQLVWCGRVLGLLHGPDLSPGVRLLAAALSGAEPACADEEPEERFDWGEPAPAAVAARREDTGVFPREADASSRPAPAPARQESDAALDLEAVAAKVAASMAANSQFFSFYEDTPPEPEPAPAGEIDPAELAPDEMAPEPVAVGAAAERAAPPIQLPPVQGRRPPKPEPSGVRG